MSWFRAHLHWSVVLSAVLCFLVILLVDIAILAVDPWVSDDALTGAGIVLSLFIFPIAWGWVLRQKGRSLWWLLLALFVPFGFLCMFALENKNSNARLLAYYSPESVGQLPSRETTRANTDEELTGDTLLERLSTRLPLEYCVKCGQQLEIRRIERAGFDPATGFPRYELILACPQATFYQTDLGASKISWRTGAGGHTVARRIATGTSTGASFQEGD